MKVRQIGKVLRETVTEWFEDEAPRLAAAMAYYTAFAIAPVLLIAIAICGVAFGQEAASQRVGQELSTLLGPKAAQSINELVASASQRPKDGIISSIIAVAIILFAASGVFGELQHALNTIWDVEPKPNQGIWGTIRSRFLSLTMVLGIGFLLLVSLVLSTVLTAVSGMIFGDRAGATFIGMAINYLVSFSVTTLLFAMIYKLIPDVKIKWGDVWVGALVTAALFTLGKELLGWYLGRASTTSAYGAAGSFVALLLWIYYSSQILFFGAEFTQVYARMYGSRIVPTENAVISGQKDPERARTAVQLNPPDANKPEPADRPVRPSLRPRPVPASPRNERPGKLVTVGAPVAFGLGLLLGKRGLIESLRLRWRHGTALSHS